MRTGLYEEKEEKKESKRKEQFDCGFLLVCVTAQLSACCTGRKPKPDEKKKYEDAECHLTPPLCGRCCSLRPRGY